MSVVPGDGRAPSGSGGPDSERSGAIRPSTVAAGAPEG